MVICRFPCCQSRISKFPLAQAVSVGIPRMISIPYGSALKGYGHNQNYNSIVLLIIYFRFPLLFVLPDTFQDFLSMSVENSV